MPGSRKEQSVQPVHVLVADPLGAGAVDIALDLVADVDPDLRLLEVDDSRGPSSVGVVHDRIERFRDAQLGHHADLGTAAAEHRRIDLGVEPEGDVSVWEPPDVLHPARSVRFVVEGGPVGDDRAVPEQGFDDLVHRGSFKQLGGGAQPGLQQEPERVPAGGTEAPQGACHARPGRSIVGAGRFSTRLSITSASAIPARSRTNARSDRA